jgi:two-component sensor histidine kinase
MRDEAAGTVPAGAGGGAPGGVAAAPPAAGRWRPRPLGLFGRVYLLVLLAVLPAVGILAYNELEARRDLERRAEEEALRSARLVSGEIGRIVENARGLLAAAALAPPVREGDRAACRDYLAALQAQAPHLPALAVLDPRGESVCTSLPRPQATSAADRAYFREALAEDGLVLGKATVGRNTGVLFLPLALRFRRPDGEVGGVVATGLPADWLRAQLAAHPFPPGTGLTVVDRAGVVFARLPNSEVEGRPVPDRLRWLLDARAGGTFRAGAAETVDGVARIAGFTTLHEPPGGLVVTVGLPQDWALAGAAERTRRGLILAALGIGLALAGAWLGCRALVARPLAALTGTAERWRGGDLSARANLPARTAEFAQLGAAFDAMADERERRERDLAAERERLRLILDNLAEAVVAVFPGEPLPVRNRAWLRFHRVAAFDDLPGLRFEDLLAVFELYDGEGRRLDPEAYPLRRALRGEAFEGLELRLRRADTGESWWASYNGSCLRDARGGMALALLSIRDVTARREAEDQRRVLLAELNHRVKNTLAVVQALASRTAARAPSLPAFNEAFRGRLRALAAAHDLLTATGWRGASLRALAASALATHRAGGDAARVSIAVAEDVQLRPEAAQNLALALNELATNAAKYGALSAPGGSVAVEARRTADGAALVLTWRESGGPPVAEPAAKGFGTTLLTQVIAHQHKGRVDLDWRPEGLVCRIELPLAEVAQRAG